MEPRQQTCEACGAQFGCGADVGGCWCNDVTVDQATLAQLRSRYARCLCPDCLRALSADGQRGGQAGAASPSIAVISASPRADSR